MRQWFRLNVMQSKGKKDIDRKELAGQKWWWVKMRHMVRLDVMKDK